MAYEVGLLCDVPSELDPENIINELCRSLEPAPVLENWDFGESWAACQAVLSPRHDPVTLQAFVRDQIVEDVVRQAISEGVISDPFEFTAVLSLTLVGEVDWSPVKALIQLAAERWRGILYDETSGFRATID